MSITRKILTAIIALAIGLIVVPGMCQYSYADEASGNEALIVETGNEYATLAEAEAALPDKGQTIKLLKDIDLGNGHFFSKKGFTLDLNGHTITSSAQWDYEYQKRGTITLESEYFVPNKIIDSSADKNGAIKHTGNGYALYMGISNNVTIEDVSVISNYDGILCGNGMILNNVKVDAGRYALHHWNDNSTVVINGGVYKAGLRTLEFSDVQQHAGSFFRINNGIFSDDRGNGSRVNLREGTRLFKITEGDYKDYWELRTIVAKRVSGGNEALYSDLQEAVDASSDGDQVVVMADCETDSLQIGKGITLDLNGKTITEKGVMVASFENGSTGTLTIKDSSATEDAAGTGKMTLTNKSSRAAFDVTGKDTKLLLESGTISAPENTAIRAMYGGEVTIAGGTVSGGVEGVHVGDTSVHAQAGMLTVTGGTISGTGYGIYGTSGSTEIKGDTAYILSEGKSIGKSDDAIFTISGGKYSDDEGNADGFTRTGGKILCRFDEAGVPVYRLAEAQALNETTGDYIDDINKVMDLLDGDDNVVKLVKDIDLGSEGIYMWGKFVLDLNGHTLTSSVNDENRGTLTVSYTGDITITDSSESKTGAIINNYSGKTRMGYAVWIDEETNLTIDGGTIKSNGTGIYCGETITMNGGKIDAGGRAIYLFPFDSSVVVNDGILKCGEDDRTFYFPYNRPGPEVTINGGYYSNSSGNDDERISRKDDMLLLKVGGTGEYKDYYELKVPVAKLVSADDEKVYADLQEAVNDAAEEDKVVMLANYETTDLLIKKKSLWTSRERPLQKTA